MDNENKEEKEETITTPPTKVSKEAKNMKDILKKIKKSAYYIAGALAIGGMFLTIILSIVGFLIVDQLERPILNQLDDITLLMEHGRANVQTLETELEKFNSTFTNIENSIDNSYAAFINAGSALSGLGTGVEIVPGLNAYGSQLKNAGAELSNTAEDLNKLSGDLTKHKQGIRTFKSDLAKVKKTIDTQQQDLSNGKESIKQAFFLLRVAVILGALLMLLFYGGIGALAIAGMN